MADTLKYLEDMLSGLEEKGKKLIVDEALFIKSQGLSEAIERNRTEVETLTTELKKSKEDLKKLKADKKAALAKVSETICAKLDEFLPVGKSFFDAEDKLSIGWEYEGNKQPYNSLSGGQKQIFNPALENLLGSNIMIVEAAEIDKDHLTTLLEDLSKVNKQIFVNTCWSDGVVVPKEFEVVEVK